MFIYREAKHTNKQSKKKKKEIARQEDKK